MVETLAFADKFQEPQPNGPKSMKFTFQPESKPLDGYTIKRAIHRGGFGEVYYALTDAGKEVALKLLKQHYDVELRGVSQCLNLKHPNLVTIFDVKTDVDGDHWVIMEFVAGKSLAQVLDEYPDGMPVDEVTRWMAGMVEGLNFLHDRGIVHRDLKPGNVFIESGVVKIGDVGLSKFISESHRSAQTQSVGTVYYMAPEVAHGRYGREVDIYSLGVVLYELLTGRVPFIGESAGEILMKHLSERPDLQPIPRRFRPILAQALEKDPLRRTPTVRQLLEDFKRAAVGYEAPQPIPDESFVHHTMADSSTIDRERGQERAHAANIGPRFQKVRQARNRFARDSYIVVEAEDVFTFGGAQPDVQCFGQPEIFREPAEPESGELFADVFRAVLGAVIDHDDLMVRAQSFEALAKLVNPIEGNDDDRDARGLALGNFDLRSQSAIVTFPRITARRAPVAEGRLPVRCFHVRCARMANAMASFASGSMPNSAVVVTRQSGRRAAICAMS